MAYRFALSVLLLAVPSLRLAADAKLAHSVNVPGPIQWIAVAPDGKHLLTSNETKPQTGEDDNFELRLWEIATGKLVAGPVKSVGLSSVGVISPDGKLALTGGWDGVYQLWSLPDLKPGVRGGTGRVRVHRAAFSPDGKHVALLLADYRKRLTDPFRASRVTYQVFTLRTIDGSRVGGTDLWPRALPKGQTADEPRTGEPADWTMQAGPAFGKDGRPIVPTGVAANSLEVPGDGDNCGGPMDYAISFDRKSAASAGCSGRIAIWNYPERKVLGEPLDVAKPQFLTRKLSFSADGRRLAMANDSTIWICDTATRAMVAGPLKSAQDAVASLTFTPTGTTLIAALSGRDAQDARVGRIQFWTLPAK